jgi:DNA-binding transcriptional ArsR family regulator
LTAAKPRSAKSSAAPARAAKCWTDAQWAAATKPHRARILVLMDNLGEATAYELAELTGRSVSSLYRHLSELTKVGLLAETHERRGGRMLRVYARGQALDTPMVDFATGAGGRQFGRLAAAALRGVAQQTQRFGTLLEAGTLEDLHPMLVSTDVAWLDGAARRRVLNHLAKALSIARTATKRRPRTGSRMQLVLCCFSDVTLRQMRGRAGERQGAPAADRPRSRARSTGTRRPPA